MIKKGFMHLAFYWWLPLLLLCLLAYWIQINQYLEPDIAILSHEALQMLQGKTYAHGIFEPNPPMIFYLNFLPVIISKLTGWNYIYVFQTYITTLIFLSILCTQFFFNIIFQSKKHFIDVMTYAWACILLFLPMRSFGQREHLLLMFTMPYVLLAAIRLENKTVKKSMTMITGIMAGIGFAIKPFFVLTLILIEFVFVYRNKSVFGWLRIESVIAALMIIFYGFAVIVFYPGYLDIIPLWFPVYKARVFPWEELIMSLPFLFACSAMTLSFFTRREEAFSAIKLILSIVMIGFAIAYLIPRVAWYYHLLPVFSVACLYFVLILTELADKTSASSTRILERLVIGVMFLTVFLIPVFQGTLITQNAMSHFHDNGSIRKLITFLDKNEPDNNYTFFSMSHRLTILKFYSTAQYVGSFSFFWEFSRFIPGKQAMAYRRDILPYVLNIISHDLNINKPRFIINDTASSDYYLHQKIDFPREYVSNKQFREAWSHYAYSHNIGKYEIYKRLERS